MTRKLLSSTAAVLIAGTGAAYACDAPIKVGVLH